MPWGFSSIFSSGVTRGISPAWNSIVSAGNPLVNPDPRQEAGGSGQIDVIRAIAPADLATSAILRRLMRRRLVLPRRGSADVESGLSRWRDRCPGSVEYCPAFIYACRVPLLISQG